MFSVRTLQSTCSLLLLDHDECLGDFSCIHCIPFFRCPVCMESSALSYLANLCDGDARSALNTLQEIIQSQAPSLNSDQSQSLFHQQGSSGLPGVRSEKQNNEENERVVISTEHVKEALQRSHVMYDREGRPNYFTLPTKCVNFIRI